MPSLHHLWLRKAPRSSSALALDRILESGLGMPELSRFFGIVVRMYFNDHHPAHFHACYGDSEALIEIDTLDILRGELPRRALAMVLEWAVLHRQELRMAWISTRGGKPASAIEPLG